jgi:hypothetical protein
MTLSTGTSNAARSKNIATEINAGKDPKQAEAIAYSKQRENRAKRAHSSDATNGLRDALRNIRDCMSKVIKP